MKYINNKFIVSLIKNLIIKLDGPTYFSNDSKNHPSDDMWLQKEVVMFLK